MVEVLLVTLVFGMLGFYAWAVITYDAPMREEERDLLEGKGARG